MTDFAIIPLTDIAIWQWREAHKKTSIQMIEAEMTPGGFEPPLLE